VDDDVSKPVRISNTKTIVLDCIPASGSFSSLPRQLLVDCTGNYRHRFVLWQCQNGLWKSGPDLGLIGDHKGDTKNPSPEKSAVSWIAHASTEGWGGDWKQAVVPSECRAFVFTSVNQGGHPKTCGTLSTEPALL
jgi:hypothetical protein